jgi:hypothetical protein
MTSRRATPAISILVDHPGDDRLLARVLDGFDRQTASPSSVERIVVDQRKYRSRAEARTAALASTRAPLAMFFDGRYWPLPGLIAYCIEVHAALPNVSDALIVGVAADASLRRDLLLNWLSAARRFPGLPAESGVYAWPHFNASVLVCKRALFALATFDPEFRAGETVELASRLVRLTPLTIRYESLPQALLLSPPSLEVALEHEYFDGYFRRVRVERDPRARTLADVEDRFAFAERFVVPHGAEIRTLVTSLRQLERSFVGVELAFPSADEADRLTLAHQLYETLFNNAAARGWLDAERGLPAVAAAIAFDASRPNATGRKRRVPPRRPLATRPSRRSRAS